MKSPRRLLLGEEKMQEVDHLICNRGSKQSSPHFSFNYPHLDSSAGSSVSLSLSRTRLRESIKFPTLYNTTSFQRLGKKSNQVKEKTEHFRYQEGER
jgi:hypothetical protein